MDIYDRYNRGPPLASVDQHRHGADDLGSVGASAYSNGSANRATYDYDAYARFALTDSTPIVHRTSSVRAATDRSGAAFSAKPTCVAAKTVDIGGAEFAQTSFSETFSKGGLFSGRTIADVPPGVSVSTQWAVTTGIDPIDTTLPPTWRMQLAWIKR